jgi:glycosyltransferase involved in cell wall biosynthesis
VPTTISETRRRQKSTSRRLRILHVLDHLALGGAQFVVFGIARLADSTRFEIHTANVSGVYDPEVIDHVRAACAGIHTIGARAAWDVRALGALVRLIRRGKFDVVHAHLMVSTILGTAAARVARRPVTVTLHNVAADRRNYPRARRLLDAFATRRLANDLVGVSDAVKQTYVDELGFPADRIRVIRNAPVAPLLLPAGFERDRKRRELGVADRLVLTSVARLEETKDHETLLKALPSVIERHPAVTLLIAGDGNLRDRLEELARSLGVAQSTRFLGVRRDAAELTSAGDALCNLTREFEGLPIAVADAMSLGVPVVATRTAALEEVLTNGHSGMLVNAGDVSGVARALIALLDDAEARRRIGAAGRRVVAAQLDPERFIREHERMYVRLDAHRRGSQLA